MRLLLKSRVFCVNTQKMRSGAARRVRKTSLWFHSITPQKHPSVSAVSGQFAFLPPSRSILHPLSLVFLFSRSFMSGYRQKIRVADHWLEMIYGNYCKSAEKKIGCSFRIFFFFICQVTKIFRKGFFFVDSLVNLRPCDGNLCYAAGSEPNC